MIRKRRLLVAPLDWGLGHATRCIPIVWQLEKYGFEVVFAASGRPLRLLMAEFPNHQFIKLQGYGIHYSKGENMILSMLGQSVKIWRAIKRENRELNRIINEFQIDGVISDNRYGLYSQKVPCVFITHQLHIQTPILQSFIQRLNLKLIKNFSACWIPDDPYHSLSGQLSQCEKEAVRCQFMGVVSRFKPMKKNEHWDILAVVSGPEPQRTLFESILIRQLSSIDKKSLLVLGKTEDDSTQQMGNLKIIGHLNSAALNQAMVNADIVICRSGYSTIMDLAKLNKRAVFVPTPGQTEQLYLANYFLAKKQAFSMKQNQFDIELALNEARRFGTIDSSNYSANWEDLFTLLESK